MQTILDSAYTWFFESLAQQSDGRLVIRLAEGIKGNERQPLAITDELIREGFVVEVLPESRCARIEFEEALHLFIFRESFDTYDPELKRDESGFLRLAESSSFRKFAESSTLIHDIHPIPYQEYMLWCEDRIIQVLASEPPEIRLEEGGPDLSLERVTTWIM